MGWLVLLFVLVPAVEIYILIKIGSIFGALPTLGLIVLTGMVGANLAQRQGLSVLERFRAETQAGRLPGDALFDGAIILVSGALLLTPGVLTDVVGFLGLLPPTRAAIKALIRRSLAKAVSRGQVRVHTYVVGVEPTDFRDPRAPMHGVPHRAPPNIRGAGPVIDITPPSDNTDEVPPRRD